MGFLGGSALTKSWDPRNGGDSVGLAGWFVAQAGNIGRPKSEGPMHGMLENYRRPRLGVLVAMSSRTLPVKVAALLLDDSATRHNFTFKI